MRRLFALILALIIVIGTAPGCAQAKIPPTSATLETTVVTEPTWPPLEYGLLDIQYIEYNDSTSVLAECESIQEYLDDLKIQRFALNIDHPDYEEVNTILVKEILRVENLIKLYQQDYERLLAEEAEMAKWDARMKEYPVATSVWLHLKNNMGYSDAACAGVIANMMAECGGQTLALEWWRYNASSHYGLCQWSSVYYPEMQGASLEEQLEYMVTSFPKVIDTYGYLYQRGFKHEDFMNMTDAGDAAYAFCIIYERPGGNQNHRRTYAQRALEYFTS